MKPWFVLLQFIQTLTGFNWSFEILFDVFPSLIYVLAISKVSKVANMNQILSDTVSYL